MKRWKKRRGENFVGQENCGLQLGSGKHSEAVSLWRCFVSLRLLWACAWVSIIFTLFLMGANFVRSPDALKIVIKCNKDMYFVCIKKPLRATAIEAPISDSGFAVSGFYYRRRIIDFAFRLTKNVFIFWNSTNFQFFKIIIKKIYSLSDDFSPTVTPGFHHTSLVENWKIKHFSQ